MKTLLTCATALTSLAVLAAAAPQDARGDYRKLLKEYDAAMAEFDAEVAKLEATDAAEAQEYAQDWNPTQAFVDRFAEAADVYAGSEDAIQFLDWIVMFDHTAGDELSEATAAALDTLIDAHAESPSVYSNIQYIGYRTSVYGEARALAICSRVVERSEGMLRHAALYGRGAVRAGGDEVSKEALELAKADFRAIPADTEIGKMARGFIFELENLQIGMVAPDIVDRDLDGVEFKLSDYRGKVVVLDFWGDW